MIGTCRSWKSLPKVLAAHVRLNVRGGVYQICARILLKPLRTRPDDDAHAVWLLLATHLSYDGRRKTHAINHQSCVDDFATHIQHRTIVIDVHATEHGALEDHA